MPTEADFQKLARTYACTSRTIRRMAQAGVYVEDPSAVACHLANQKSISVGMAEAVLAQLKTVKSNDQ